MMLIFLSVCLFLSTKVRSFQTFPSSRHIFPHHKHISTTSRHGFFDRLADAFANDKDYDEKEDAGVSKKTSPNGKSSNSRKVYEANLLGTSWNVSLALNGMPSNNDPSSDLFAVKSTDTGLPVNLYITLGEAGRIAVEDNDFTAAGAPGKWQIDADGTTLALSFAALGFERTIVTKGSLQSVYGGSDTMRTSSTYFVPAGTCLVQTTIVMNESGRLVVAPGKVLGKDPRETNAGKWSQAPSWKRTGSLLSAVQMQQTENGMINK